MFEWLRPGDALCSKPRTTITYKPKGNSSSRHARPPPPHLPLAAYACGRRLGKLPAKAALQVLLRVEGDTSPRAVRPIVVPFPVGYRVETTQEKMRRSSAGSTGRLPAAIPPLAVARPRRSPPLTGTPVRPRQPRNRPARPLTMPRRALAILRRATVLRPLNPSPPYEATEKPRTSRRIRATDSPARTATLLSPGIGLIRSNTVPRTTGDLCRRTPGANVEFRRA